MLQYSDQKIEPNKISDYTNVFESENLVIYINESQEYLFIDWIGYLDSTIVEHGCQVILEVLKQHPHTIILNSNLKILGNYPTASKWVDKMWFPQLFDLGVRSFAWVYAPDFFQQLIIDKIVSDSTKVNVETFFSITDAKIWLSNQVVNI
jgi:hypothetical protein